jgi:hypothetical protein
MYEVLNEPIDRESDGILCTNLGDALAIVEDGGEIWMLADDEPRTRVLLVHPQHMQELRDALPR